MSMSEGVLGALSSDPQPARPSSRDRFYGGAAAGVTALVVDDDYSNIFALSVLLKRGRMTVLTAESGSAALDILDHTGEVGIVMMDIMMPVMDGYEAMGRIRARPEFAELPIIAISGKATNDERARCIAAGASDFVPKPIDTEVLLTAIGYWLGVSAA
jgi:CheY-like chemotaxis protein